VTSHSAWLRSRPGFTNVVALAEFRRRRSFDEPVIESILWASLHERRVKNEARKQRRLHRIVAEADKKLEHRRAKRQPARAAGGPS
jgi:hypothetical protein